MESRRDALSSDEAWLSPASLRSRPDWASAPAPVVAPFGRYLGLVWSRPPTRRAAADQPLAQQRALDGALDLVAHAFLVGEPDLHLSRVDVDVDGARVDVEEEDGEGVPVGGASWVP